MAKKKEILSPKERLQVALVPESEQPYKVPGNWCWTQLGTYIDFATDYVANGSFASLKQNVAYYKEENYAILVKTQDFSNSFTEDLTYTDKRGYDFLKKSVLYGGELILSNIGSIGKVFRVPHLNKPMTLAPNSIMIKCYRETDYDLLYYYFLSPFGTEQLYSITTGTAVKKFNKTDLKAICLPLPPLSEQQRIVDRIESLFAKLDEAKQKAQEALDSFETRKAAILHKAFTGELTAQWRKEHSVGMETWSSCKLIDILVEKPRNGYSPKPVDYVTACKSMTLSATTTGVFKPEFFKYIDEEIPENSHLWLTPGDILIQRANSLEKVGMSAIYTGAEHEFIYPDLMMKLTVKEPNNKHYIDYYLKTDEILNYFRSNATGTAGNMPKINQKVVSETPLILPETQEQAEIVRLLDDLLAKEQQAKEAAEGVLEQIDLIKKAILARAFRGELGTNDPSEESAVELVKRVLAVEPPPEARAKAVSIPREVEKQLKCELERKIMKLYYYSDSRSLPINTLMEVSSKKFEVLESIRNLEQRGIIKKLPNGNYKLVR